MRRVPFTTWLFALLGYLLAHSVGALKWRLMVNSAGAGLRFAEAACCYGGGLFGTLFLPSIVGGDFVRLALALGRSRRRAAVLLGNAADRLVDIAALGTLAVLGVALLPGSLSAERPAWLSRGRLFLLLALATLGVALALVAVCRSPLIKRLSFRNRRRLVRLRQALQTLAKRPRAVVLAWTLGVSVQGTFILLTMRIAEGCGLHLPLRVWLFAWPLAKLAALVPVTQGGIGVREAALVGLVTPFGASPAQTLAAGLIWEAVIVAGGLLAGLASFSLRRAGRREADSALP